MEDSSCFVYFPQDLLWQFWALCGIINFRIILSSAVANVRYSDRNCIKYINYLEYYAHFNNINSSNPRAYDTPPFLESFAISFVYIFSVGRSFTFWLSLFLGILFPLM